MTTQPSENDHPSQATQASPSSSTAQTATQCQITQQQALSISSSESACSLTNDDYDEEVEEQLYKAVLAAVDMEELLDHAESLYQRLTGKPTTATTAKGTCGSFNVCFPVVFEDGSRWLVKLPFTGTKDRWNASAAAALTSEVNTMRLLKRETTIPIPEVIDYSNTIHNPMACPYIIMTFIPGRTLYDSWNDFDESVGEPTIRQRRTRALEGIADAMVQLSKFTFPTGGAPVFNDDGSFDSSRTAPLRQWDHLAVLESEDNDRYCFADCPPSRDTTRSYTFMLDEHPTDHEFAMGVDALIRQLVAWIPEPEPEPATVGSSSSSSSSSSASAPPNRFVLAHPDFNLQNFIVNEDGELQAIIDWDGVAAVPRSCGNERYPQWLVTDWEDHYVPDRDDEEGKPGSGQLHKDLPEYRNIYRDLLAKAKAKAKCAPTVSNNAAATSTATTTAPADARPPRLDLCRMSLITSNLLAAVNDQLVRHGVLYIILEECWAAEGKPNEWPLLDELGSILQGKQKDTDGSLQTLRNGFLKLLANGDLCCDEKRVTHKCDQA